MGATPTRKKTFLRTPPGQTDQWKKFWNALKPQVVDNEANALALKIICDLLAIWEEKRLEAAPQKFYHGQAALKQALRMATSLGIWKNTPNTKPLENSGGDFISELMKKRRAC